MERSEAVNRLAGISYTEYLLIYLTVLVSFRREAPQRAEAGYARRLI